MMRIRYLLVLFACSYVWIPSGWASAADFVIDIAFPTDPAAVTYQDDFGESRGSRSHEGVDLIGPKMTPLYAANDGVVSFITIPEASWGYHLAIRDDEGYEYHYLHINNDTPGTNDGKGGTEHAYAPGIMKGARVTRGQLVAWMGDSGNAEGVTSHLHFEIRKNGAALNPYQSLVAAEKRTASGEASLASHPLVSPNVTDINQDKNLVMSADAEPCVSGTLVKSSGYSAVYYCGADGKRYAFPNERVYFSWYDDFDDVRTVTEAELAAMPLGGNVTYRPGSRMVKIESMPNVYLVERGGVLRWIQSPTLAAQLYGSGWKSLVDDLSDALFVNYRMGEPISSL